MLLNMIGFNVLWFGLVYFGNIFIPVALIALCLHLTFVSTIKKETNYVLAVMCIGIVLDSFLTLIGVFIFNEFSLIPFWLMTLWACFAATLCHSLSFLQSSKWLQLLAGGLFAPFSYIAGSQLQAVNFGLPLINTFIILSVIWAALFILIYLLKSLIIKPEVEYV